MPISVTCPACGFQTVLKDSAAGKKGKCPKCSGVVQVPEAPPPVVEAEVVGADAEDALPANFFSDRPAMEPMSAAAVASSTMRASESSGGDRKPCRSCGEMIAASALKCRFCGDIFDPALKKQAAKDAKKSRYAGDEDDMSTGDWVAAILCSGIGCIAGIIWMIQGKPKGKKMVMVSFLFMLIWGAIRAAIENAK